MRPAPIVAALVLSLWLVAVASVGAAAPAEGQLTWAVHVALAPTWFDPAETPGIMTPFMVLYGLHDALVKPMPGNKMSPSLAESWSVSPDGLVYDFVLRKGVQFHNGEPVTADDVKFSFERYRGVASKLLKDKVRQAQVVDAHRVRFHLKEPWPDFLTYYATPATGAGWIVPRKYLDRVGDDGFKKAPIGAGPYRFVSFTPGVELVLEAFEPYWRKAPSVKRLVLKVVSDDTTRAAMMKRGEADIGYTFRGVVAEDLKRLSGFTLKPTLFNAAYWMLFTEQWDAKSPWADRRVRLAVNHAIDRPAINQSLTLGFSRITGSIVPQDFEFAWPAPLYEYDPRRAKQLLAEAGYPNGFDAGEMPTDPSFGETAEPVVGYLAAVGIRTRLRTVERAAFYAQVREKKIRPLVYMASAAAGTAATRLEAFVAANGIYTYGSYPDIEALIQDQATERDRKRRETTLHRIQQLIHERAMFAPIWEIAAIQGYGARVAEPALGLITGFPWSAPYEELRLKGR